METQGQRARGRKRGQGAWCRAHGHGSPPWGLVSWEGWQSVRGPEGPASVKGNFCSPARQALPLSPAPRCPFLLTGPRLTQHNGEGGEDPAA